MACCGQGKKKGFRPNGKICPNCRWVMRRVHKYDATLRKTVLFWTCPNKLFNGRPCNTRIE